tara:strand:- start:258 stop:455 length:198 start_codon:yes stop_codon:yes gene_type:complete
MGLVFNTQRKSKRESTKYYHTNILYNDKEVDILLTENDVKRGIYRAERNQEDIPRKWYECMMFWR